MRIETADTAAGYEGLRSLWCEVFGDSPEYVDSVYELFGSEIKGYIAVDDGGKALSALSCYRCGDFEGRPVFVSYAVCTKEEARGLGLAGRLTELARDEVIKAGGISIVSPAEPSLEDYYRRFGYEPFFFAAGGAVLSPDADMGMFEDFDDFDLDIGEDGEAPALEPELKSVTAEVYNRYREAFLAGRSHIRLSEAMLRLVSAESMDGSGLFVINGGDAVCALSSVSRGTLSMSELIVNPLLLELSPEIEGEIASLAAKHFGAAEAVFSSPGAGACQSMAAGIERGLRRQESEYVFSEAYFGFPIE